jgi:chromosome partitioning protein
MIRVIFNRKGGVGKSTITCNLAAISAACGKRTLVIDLDAQANSSEHLLGNSFMQSMQGVTDLLEQSLSFKLVNKEAALFVHPTRWDNLFVMPASDRLGELQTKLENKHKIYKLRDAVQKLAEHYDNIYIDTPPAINIYTISALIAADSCLIPFDCDDFSRQALYAVRDFIEEVKNDHNEKLFVEGVVINQFQSRARLPAQMVEELKQEGLPVIDAFLSSSIKVRESHELKLPMVHMDPGHKLTLEFQELYSELDEA